MLYLRRRDFVRVCSFLKYHWYSRLHQVTELVCLDYPKNLNRFELLYFFLSYTFTSRVVCRVLLPQGDIMASLTFLFPGLNWQEREVWDMFGITFLNHPDLRRILTDYGFLGHPLRKDFPVSGFVEVYFDETTQLVCYQPLSLAQEFRDFGTFTNPWILPLTK